MKTSKKGFTLIELLVVIAIIGILAATIIISLNNSRKKARDSQRKSSVVQLQTSVEAYAATNGAYPDSTQFEPGRNINFAIQSNDSTDGFVQFYDEELKNDLAKIKDPLTDSSIRPIVYVGVLRLVGITTIVQCYNVGALLENNLSAGDSQLQNVAYRTRTPVTAADPCATSTKISLINSSNIGTTAIGYVWQGGTYTDGVTYINQLFEKPFISTKFSGGLYIKGGRATK